jgi:hypothetical protein
VVCEFAYVLLREEPIQPLLVLVQGVEAAGFGAKAGAWIMGRMACNSSMYGRTVRIMPGHYDSSLLTVPSRQIH